MVRTQVQLTEDLADKLRVMAKREGVSKAEIIRRALERATQTTCLPDYEELKRRALAAAGSLDLGAPDVSVNHDKYLSEIHEN